MSELLSLALLIAQRVPRLVLTILAGLLWPDCTQGRSARVHIPAQRRANDREHA